MAQTTREKAASLLLSHKRYVRYLVVLACTAAVVILGVALSLRQSGQAATYEVTILDCQYAGNGAHTHNDDCYDADGNLVCPLEERELHIHDDSCYTHETTLVCGQEESEGHKHDESCYDEEGNLICGQEESEGHHHTDECYETTSTLTCGQEEVTEEHVHGPGCFTTITVSADDEEPVELQGEEEAPVEETPAPSHEQTLAETLRRHDEEGNEYVALAAQVKAPVGTLPANASLHVAELDEALASNEERLVDEALVREFGNGITIKQSIAAEFKLLDENGEEVTPEGNVEVRLNTGFIHDAEELVIVKLPEPQKVDEEAATLVNDVTLVNWDETDLSMGNEDTLMFWTNEKLASYVILEVDTSTVTAEPEPELITTTESNDEGEGETTQTTTPQPNKDNLIEITIGGSEDSAIAMPEQSFEETAGEMRVIVKAPQGAFPADTTMRVKMVAVEDVEDAVKSALPGIYEQMAAVDITFYDKDGKEIEPLVPIKVTMIDANVDAAGQGQPIVMHVDEEGNASVVTQSAITTSSDEVIFDTDSF